MKVKEIIGTEKEKAGFYFEILNSRRMVGCRSL
jgi:hypothetical protein